MSELDRVTGPELALPRKGVGRSSRGELTAQIIDNHFFVRVRKALRLDRSDPHALGIFDGDNQLLEFNFTNPTTLRVLGTIYGPLGTHLDVLPDEMKVNGRLPTCAKSDSTCVSSREDYVRVLSRLENLCKSHGRTAPEFDPW
jgi:hypothetical protein